MKHMLRFLIPVVLFLSACGQGQPSTPPVNVVQTSVALTLTAYPSFTPSQLPSSTPLVSTPTTTVTETPTNPLLPTPTNLTPAPTIPVIPPTAAPAWNPSYPDQFIRYYYQHINARDYNTTWSLLSDVFKFAVNSTAEGGYGGYVDFWDTVRRVDINSVTIISQSSHAAQVLVDMVYNYTNGAVIRSQQYFQLYYYAPRSTWMFDYSGTMPTSVPNPSTPDQFIYYYFNNINARNYSLTWTLLSDSFKAQNNPDGYGSYVNFWNSVTQVNITYITIDSQSSGSADVTVGMIFRYNTGRLTTGNQVFHLIYNSGIPSWQFNSP
jgi:hypothetical protein